MKKFTIAAMIASTTLHASPVGNTYAPGLIQKGLFISCDSWIDCRAGYEGDFVADGRVKQFDQGTGRVDTFQQWTHSGTFTFNILDRMDIYGVCGSSQTEADWRFVNGAAGTVNRIRLKSRTDFLWASGARAILFEWCKTSLGLGGRYTACHYTPKWLTSNGIHQSVSGAQFHWREWQINLDLSCTIHLFTPYIGVKYSHARTLLRDFAEPISASLTGGNSFENRIPVGLYLGCALSSGKYFMLNLEGRLVDEEAITLSAEFRF